ncbi:MAG: type IX secretion system protein PorQ [Bacteroidetes bacterium]|nr:type IX secretion system protein PorQ [Bacteroidota bacterium]
MKLNLIGYFLLIFTCASAQYGGNYAFKFLDIPMTSRAAANGGTNMGLWNTDIHSLHSNPALLNKYMAKQIALNYCNYVSDLNFGYGAYAYSLKQKGVVAASIQFYDYGSFNGYDEFGNKTNNFKANDYSINLSYAKPFKDSSFNIGATLKTLISTYDIYQSYGNAIDFGIIYHKNNFNVSILAKNFGFVYKTYTNTSVNDKLPTNLQLGLSYKLPKAPFRPFVTFDYLNKKSLKYISPVDTTGKTNVLVTDSRKLDSTGFQKFAVRFNSGFDGLMRHTIIGTEIVFTKNFNLQIAYNYRRQKEMTLPERRGVNGLSFGFNMNFKRFAFAYSFSKMAFPGNASIFSLTIKH